MSEGLIPPLAPENEVVSVEGRHRGLDSVMGAGRVAPIAVDLLDRLTGR